MCSINFESKHHGIVEMSFNSYSQGHKNELLVGRLQAGMKTQQSLNSASIHTQKQNTTRGATMAADDATFAHSTQWL
jgi:hypothetical protein